MATKRSRAFVLTIPNPLMDITIEYLSQVGDIEYFVAQKEKAPSTEMVHYQCACHFANNAKKSFKQVHEIFDKFASPYKDEQGAEQSGVAWIQEKSKYSSWQQVRDYCMKDDTCLDVASRIEFGTLPLKGARTDLSDLKEKIMQGASMADIIESDFGTSVRYGKTLAFLSGFYKPVRTEKTRVKLIVGETGTGKSKACWDYVNASGKTYYYKDNSKWWDYYNQQDVVILDDYYGHFPYSMFLNLLDRYPLKVEFKGGMTEFNSKEIWITSNRFPFDWYQQDEMAPLYRRLDEVVLVTKENVYPIEVHWQKDKRVSEFSAQSYILSYEMASLIEPFTLF